MSFQKTQNSDFPWTYKEPWKKAKQKIIFAILLFTIFFALGAFVSCKISEKGLLQAACAILIVYGTFLNSFHFRIYTFSQNDSVEKYLCIQKKTIFEQIGFGLIATGTIAAVLLA